MSTPEEQQQRQQQHQQQQEQQQDPYGTQTWQSDTWDTSYQPVHPPVQPPLGSVPGQPVAPEGWFRDEAPAQAPAAPQGWDAGQPAYPPPAQDRPVAPDGWFRDPAPAAPPVQQQWSQPAPWQQTPAPDAAAERTAYLPPVREAAAEQTAYLPPVREAAAEQAAYMPPAQDRAAEQTAYLPPVREAAAEQAAYMPPAQDRAAEQTAYLPPVREAAAEQTAYLPPVQDRPAPDGWFRDEAPAPAQAPAAPQGWDAEQAAYLPPQAPAPDAAAERTAYLPPVPPEASAEYSPPTLGGNTLRAVDPAQARAEGRSPIIDPGPQSAILTAALGVLMAAAAVFGQYALLLPLVALQGLTAAGWFRLNGMWPARQGIVLAFAGALAADGAVLAVDRTYGPGAIIGTLGAWVLLTLVLQLRSHADPDERMYGLMASVASAALAIVCAGYLAADGEAVSVGAAAVAVAVFARALPLPTAPSVAVSLAAAAGAGIAVGGMTGMGAGGALLGLAAGVCALIGLRVAAYDYPSKFVHMTAGVALPLAAAAPAVYLIGRVVG